MRRILLLFIGILLSIQAIQGAVIFNEDFASSIPGTWTTNDAGSNAIYQSATGGYILLENTADFAYTPSYDLTSYSNLEMSVSIRSYGSGTDRSLFIEVSTDNGTTWTAQTYTTPVTTSSYVSHSFTVSASSANTRFRFSRPDVAGRGVRLGEVTLTGDFSATGPPTPTAFTIDCASGSEMNLSWANPSGYGTDWDGLLIFASENTPNDANITGDDGSAITVNANFASATAYESGASKAVANFTDGATTSFTLSGMTYGATYNFVAYTYKNDTPDDWSSATSEENSTASTASVSGTTTSGSDGEITLNWSNPASTACYDNVIIIAREASAVEAAVSQANLTGLADASDLTGANADWSARSISNDIEDLTAIGTASTNYLVYNGSGTSATITGLTNGTAYHFRFFVEDGSGTAATWSSAVNVNATPSSDIFISEYAEGNSGVERYIEIYNGTGSDVSLSDYALRLYFNGNTSYTTISLGSGTLANGDAFVVYNGSDYTGDLSDGSLNFNGDDAVALYNTGTSAFADIIGQIGCDPGSAWTGSGIYSTANTILTRKEGVCSGITTNPTGGCGTGSFPTLESEWYVVAYSAGALNLGTHICSGVPPISNLTFTADCTNEATVSWNLPSSYDASTNSILIFAKATTAVTVGTPTNFPSSYTAVSDFTGAGTAYQNDGTAKCVYNGDGTTFTFTGLSAGVTYHFLAFNVEDATPEYSDEAIANGATLNNPPEVTGLTGTFATTQVSLNWANPSTCFDEIMVVADIATVSGTPTGNGSAYTANASYGSGTAFGTGNVVFKGSGTAVTISDLTNNTLYYFKVFVRFGTEWSLGEEISLTPFDGTVLYPGDMAIIGWDAQINGTGADDRVYFTNLVDLNPGTSFQYVNAFYEEGAAANTRTNLWHDVEVVEFQYTGATVLTAGSVLRFNIGAGAAVNPTDLELNGSNTTLFTATTTTSTTPNISTSNPDQLFLMQGAFADLAANPTTFSGRILHGLTNQVAWADFTDVVGTRQSRIPPEIFCLNFEFPSGEDLTYYDDGSLHVGTQRNLLKNIQNEAVTWSQTSPLPTSLSTFTVTSGTVDGRWVGDSNTDWFDCENWDKLSVPTSEMDVTVSSFSVGNSVVSNASAFADDYLNTASCKTLTIDQDIVQVTTTSDTLEILGDLTINGTGSLSLNTGGVVRISGSWANQLTETAFTEGTGLVIFTDTSPQAISTSSGAENFYHLALDKADTSVLLSSAVIVKNQLTMTQGNIDATSNLLTLGENATAVGTLNYTNGFVFGEMRRYFANGTNSGLTSSLFPMGVLDSTEQARFLTVEFTSAPTTGGHLTTQFVPASMGTAGLPILATNTGGAGFEVKYTSVDGYWQVDNDNLSDGNYTLTCVGQGMIVDQLTNLTLLKRVGAGNWTAPGTHITPSGSTDSVTVSRSGLSGWSNFGFGGGDGTLLPVELLRFWGQKQSNFASLDWETASEVNNRGFAVEKSIDGTNFQAIGFVDGLGNTKQLSKYNFIDNEFTQSAYYRLKQEDYSGDYSYSRVIQLQTDSQISLYPNPTQNNIQLSGIPQSEEIALAVYGLDGKLCMELWGNQATLNTQLANKFLHLAKGMYLVNVKTVRGAETFKVMKQ